MNERIKTLLYQCTSYYQVTNEYGNDIDIESVDQEKFAELIIQECIQCIDNEIGRLAEYHNSLNESETEKRYDVELCMKKCYDNIELLKTHFGVE